MGLFDYLMRQVAGRAQARADLVNVGAHGTARDLIDLLPLLPPLDAFGEAASEAVLRILDRATDTELGAWDEASRSLRGMRFHRLGADDVETSRDLGTLALAVFHPEAAVRAAAMRRLEAEEGALPARLLALRHTRGA